MGRLVPFATLVGMGAAWGLSLPLIRIAVSTGYRPLGLVLLQWLIMVPALLLLRRPLPRVVPNLGLFLAVAAFGTVIPGYFTFLTAAHVPAGVRGIIIALVPMLTLPMAIAVGFERFVPSRMLGVLLGAAAIVLIGLPGAGVTSHVGVGMILLATVSPLSYACEAIYLGWRGARGLDPLQVMVGAAGVGILLTLPLAAATGEIVRPVAFGAAEWAILASGLLNAGAYSAYVWLVARAGSVFASQIGYLVTAFGVLFSRLILGESYAPLVWAAFALMLAGMALVQPLGAIAKDT